MPQDVEMMPAKTAQEAEDPFLVTLDSDENPLTWRNSKKWTVTDILSATGFNRIMVSTIVAPALPTIIREFNMTPAEGNMALSIYLLAAAIGPLFIGPLSEVYGRKPVLHISNIWFLIWNIVCGFATTKGVLIGARFMSGFGASAIYALGGGVLADIWHPEQRGRTLGMFMLIPLLGAAVGPIIGGFIATRAQWRWSFWATSAFQGVMIVVAAFTFEETHAPVLLKKKARKIRKETNNDCYYALVEKAHGRKLKQVLGRALHRPLRLLAFHPIIQISAIIGAFHYGLLYILLATFADVWITRYHQSAELSGLHYIALAGGEIAGSQVAGWLIDRIYRKAAAASSDGIPRPEHRIPLAFAARAIVPVGLLIYGWTIEYKQTWVAVDIGMFVALFGMQMAGNALQAYEMDIYTEYASSALAASTFLTSLCGFLFPLFAPAMYKAMGYGWGNSLLAFLVLFIGIPMPMLLLKYGERLRGRIQLD